VPREQGIVARSEFVGSRESQLRGLGRHTAYLSTDLVDFRADVDDIAMDLVYIQRLERAGDEVPKRHDISGLASPQARAAFLRAAFTPFNVTNDGNNDSHQAPSLRRRLDAELCVHESAKCCQQTESRRGNGRKRVGREATKPSQHDARTGINLLRQIESRVGSVSREIGYNGLRPNPVAARRDRQRRRSKPRAPGVLEHGAEVELRRDQALFKRADANHVLDRADSQQSVQAPLSTDQAIQHFQALRYADRTQQSFRAPNSKWSVRRAEPCASP
jgi:hypothetical protein